MTQDWLRVGIYWNKMMGTKKYITVFLLPCMLEIFHHKKFLKINCIFESKQSNCAVPMTEQRSPWLLRSFVLMACGRQKNGLQRHVRPNCEGCKCVNVPGASRRPKRPPADS